MRKALNPYLIIFAALMVGCSDAKWFGAAVDARTEPTHWFWAGINGIKYRGRAEMDRLTEQMTNAQQQQDLDSVAGAMQALGEKYSETAGLLDNLNASDVDAEAVAFRNRYVAFHRDVGALYIQISAATRDRDTARIQQLNAELRTLHAQAPQLRSEKDALEATLSKRYARDFNNVDHQ